MLVRKDGEKSALSQPCSGWSLTLFGRTHSYPRSLNIVTPRILNPVETAGKLNEESKKTITFEEGDGVDSEVGDMLLQWFYTQKTSLTIATAKILAAFGHMYDARGKF